MINEQKEATENSNDTQIELPSSSGVNEDEVNNTYERIFHSVQGENSIAESIGAATHKEEDTVFDEQLKKHILHKLGEAQTDIISSAKEVHADNNSSPSEKFEKNDPIKKAPAALLRGNL